MTESRDIAPWKGAIIDAQHRFVAIADEETWIKESFFAQQIILKNEYLMKIANSNPASLRNAVTNVAAIGITLNPALALAYIVPRDGAACLDISYRGLIKLGTDSGAIAWAQAENVYSNDTFTFNGPVTPPEHRYDPFAKDRGEYQGSYCVARTADGDVLCEVMSAEEIYGIRDKSEMFKKTGRGPWKDFFGEMAKKTVIKRASKTWPKSVGTGRLEKAIDMLNENGEGIKFEQQETKIVEETYTEKQLELFQSLLNSNDSLGLWLLGTSMPASALNDLYNSGAKGQKVKVKNRCDAMLIEGREIFEAIEECLDRGDEAALSELTEGCQMLDDLPLMLGPEHRQIYKELIEAAA